MFLPGWTYARYVFASAAALAADLGIYVLLLSAGIDAVAAAVAGYSLGVAVHWLLSTRLVFRRSGDMKGGERWRAKVLFALTAVVGVGTTAGVVALCVYEGLSPLLAKLIAIAVSFNVTYVLRRWLVFAS